MSYLKFALSLLFILHVITVTIKASEAEAEKKLRGSRVEKESKKVSELENIIGIKKKLGRYIAVDQKHAYKRAQLANDDLGVIIRAINTNIDPSKISFTPESLTLTSNALFNNIMPKITVPALIEFVDMMKKSLENGIAAIRRNEETEWSFLDRYSRLLECCREFLLIVTTQQSKTFETKLSESEVKSTITGLLKAGSLLNPKMIVEKIYSHKSYGYCGGMREVLDQFWKQVLNVDLWGKSIKDYEKLLETIRKEKGIVFSGEDDIVLEIFTKALKAMLHQKIPIVLCPIIFLKYLDQVKDAFWAFYASRIHMFESNGYYSSAEEIAESAIQFILLHPSKEKAKAVVMEVVINGASSIFNIAFEHSKNGVVTTETIYSLQDSIQMMFVLLYKTYSSSQSECFKSIRMINDRFLEPLIHDLLTLDEKSFSVDSGALSKAIEARLQKTKDIISQRLKEMGV